MAPRQLRRDRPEAGFTLLEILIAMAVFSVLGTMLIFFMRASLDIFYTGTREAAQLDRQDMLLPQVRADLASLIIPDDFTPPRPIPDQALLDSKGIEAPEPSPAVRVRLRAGYIRLQRVGDPGFKDYPCPWFSCVVADGSEWSDRLKRRAGETPTSAGGQQPLTPQTVIEGDRHSQYLPTQGLMEVCWIAVPQDAMDPPGADRPRFPGILTLYRGFRTPIGDPEKSLLLPENLNSPDKIRKACRPIAEGLVHFGATWRRVFATDWEQELAVGGGETAPYVGPVWDSTRALDKAWSLFRHKDSLSDPSDDIFPAFVKLEATLAKPTQFGHGRGEFRLLELAGADDGKLKVSETDTLLAGNYGNLRWLKVDGEWMQYRTSDVDYMKNEVRVLRGQRGTKKVSHPSGAWIYVGTPSAMEVRLPVFRDHYAVQEEGTR